MTSDYPPAHQRLRKFVDGRLQTSLIAAMVGTQLVLVALCIWQLDVHLHAVLDAQTYRIHFQAPPDGEAFRAEVLRLLALFTVANLALVFLIELMWKWYVSALLQRYRALLLRVQGLDFTADPQASEPHRLFALAQRWHGGERRRLLELRRCRAAMESMTGNYDGRSAMLAEIAALLPETDKETPS